MLEPDEETRESAGPELRDYRRMLRERAWIVILAVLVVVGASLTASYLAIPQYRASSKMVYQTNTLDRALFGTQVFADTNQPRDVETAAELVKLTPVAEAVKEQLGSARSPGALLAMVSVVPSSTTNVMRIDVVGPDPKEAAEVANAFAKQFILFRQNTDQATVAAARQLVKEQLDGLSPADAGSSYGLMLKEKYESLQILESMQTGGFTLVQSAMAPGAPFSPQPLRSGLLALCVGLVLGVGCAFLLAYLDKRLKDEKALERAYGLPVLASVPLVGRRWKKGHSGRRSVRPVGFVSQPALLESFRTLRSGLQNLDLDQRMRSLLVISGLPQEGKTVTSVNLALSLALSGKRVILLEADLRRPMVPAYLDLNNDKGLSTVLAGGAGLKDCLQLVRLDSFIPEKGRKGSGGADGVLIQENLYCMASGPVPPNPAELLGSGRMEEIVRQLSKGVDYLVIDAPPVLAVADGLALAAQVDAVIVVARINRATRDEAHEVRAVLDRAGARVVGLVALGAKPRASLYKGRGHVYGNAET